MKYLLTIALLGIVSAVFSQKTSYEISDFSGTYISNRISNSDDNLRVEDVLWEESFNDGIPFSWINQNYDSDNNLTSAAWEYRGPNTTPNNTIGSRGSCVESGTEEGMTINSLSLADGFIIFDSDYWDSSEGDCEESLGTGVAPAPHHASLTTSSFDFSDQPHLGLIFTQYLKNFNAQFKVQLSVNNGEFQDVYVSNITETNVASPRDMKVRKNISELAGNQSDVRIRFYFEEMYYFWMIDDCKIVALEENNLEIINAQHDSFLSENNVAVESFEGLPYFQYPTAILAVIKGQVNAENRGALEQSNCALEISVHEETDLVEASTSAAISMTPETASSFIAPEINLPNVLADYELTYTITQDSLDASPENNTTVSSISVTESTLARDEGITEAYFLPAEEFANQQYEIGTVYQPSVSELELHSISAGLGSNTNTNLTVYASLYGIDVNSGVILDPIASTELYNISAYELNEIGDNHMKVLEFTEPITLYQDSAYLAVIGTTDSFQDVTFSVSGDSAPYTSWAKFEDNTVFYLDKTPMVRMNFGIVTNVEERAPEIRGAVYPNPASDNLVIEYSFNEPSELIIGLFDVNGRLIEELFAGKNGAGTHQLQVNVANIPSGTYVVKIYSQHGKLEETLIIK